MLKKKLLFILPLICLFQLNAQEKSNITLRVEPGFLLGSNSENLGVFINIEPKIKISQGIIIGLRFGLTTNPQKFEANADSPFLIDDKSDHSVISFVPTFDYYLNENNFRPYFGAGLGYYLVSQVAIVNPPESMSEGSVNNQIGFLIRVGLESGKTRVGLEYNFIPKADIEIPDGQIIGTVNNSYFGLSIGFTIGSGK